MPVLISSHTSNFIRAPSDAFFRVLVDVAAASPFCHAGASTDSAHGVGPRMVIRGFGRRFRAANLVRRPPRLVVTARRPGDSWRGRSARRSVPRSPPAASIPDSGELVTGIGLEHRLLVRGDAAVQQLGFVFQHAGFARTAGSAIACAIRGRLSRRRTATKVGPNSSTLGIAEER